MMILFSEREEEYADVTNGAGAEEGYENATEMDFMRAGASSRFNSEYEIPDHLREMSQNPERLYEEGKQPPVAEDSDSIKLTLHIGT